MALAGLELQPGAAEQVGQADAQPRGIADRPTVPGDPGDRRREVRPAVARALEHGGQLHLLQRRQVGEREHERPLDQPADLEPPGARATPPAHRNGCGRRTARWASRNG